MLKYLCDTLQDSLSQLTALKGLVSIDAESDLSLQEFY
jgi:hypothetical protein